MPRARHGGTPRRFATLSTRFENGSGICTAPRSSPAERVRGERGAAEPALVGRLADQHEHGVLDLLGHTAPQHAVPGRDPDRHHVDEAVVLEAPVEAGVSAQVRHAERVAVVGDAANDAAHDVAHADALVGVAEAQRVEHAGDAGAHAHHVAHDAPDARGRALDGQNLARMVVALVREHEHEVLARRGQRDHARVLARAEHDLRRTRREPREEGGASTCRSSARSTGCRTAPPRPSSARGRGAAAGAPPSSRSSATPRAASAERTAAGSRSSASA
jgi:hypothetical protein